MDKSLPEAAQTILKYIYSKESGGNYETISAHKQHLLPKPITKMTIDEIIRDGVGWIGRKGPKAIGTISSAAGAPQIIKKTMIKLKEVMGLTGSELYTPGLQDRMAFQLLRYRGYDQFMAGNLSVEAFARNLAQEWASMPVLAGTKNSRGQNIKRGAGYYDGDGLNSASHANADDFERVLKTALGQTASANVKPAPSTVETTTKITAAVSAGAAVTGLATDAAKSVTDWSPVIDLARTVGTYGPYVAGAVLVVIVAAVAVRKLWK